MFFWWLEVATWFVDVLVTFGAAESTDFGLVIVFSNSLSLFGRLFEEGNPFMVLTFETPPARFGDGIFRWDEAVSSLSSVEAS